VKHYHFLIVIGILVLTAGFAIGVAAQDPEAPSPEDAIGEEPDFLAGYWQAWAESPHARFEDGAFRHWDEDGEIQENCAA